MTDKITSGQMRSLRSGIGVVAGKDEAAHVYIVNVLLKSDVTALEDLTYAHWMRLRDRLYPHWRDGDWSLSDKFRKQCADLFADYREAVLGQRRMF